MMMFVQVFVASSPVKVQEPMASKNAPQAEEGLCLISLTLVPDDPSLIDSNSLTSNKVLYPPKRNLASVDQPPSRIRTPVNEANLFRG